MTFEDELLDLLSKPSLLDKYLPAQFYGDWYHNVGFLVVGTLLSWTIGWFRFSVAPLFFVIVAFSVIYRTSIKKYRTVLREVAQREFSVKSIENDYETMDWLNTFLEKLWYFLEPSISQIVCEQANPILASSPAPAFIKALWVDSFTAGTKPPRIDMVKTLHGTKDDIVVMDWGFSFTPSTIVDSTAKQMRNTVNQKTVIKLNVFGITIPVSVSDVSFKGLARVRLRMMSSFPHIETVNVSLLEAPQFDFNCKVFGDSVFNWEVLGFPGLYPFINDMVKKYVGAFVFSPLSFQLNLQQLLAGNALDSAIGVLVILLKSGRGLKGSKNMGNTIDPYITFGFKSEILAKSSIKEDTTTPVWDETYYIPVKSLSEPLNLSIIDFNEFRKDRPIGSIQFDLETFVENAKQPSITAPVIRNNKPVGELIFGLQYFKTLEAHTEVDGAIVPPPDLNTGIARFLIVEARHLKSSSEKGATTYAELFIGTESVLTTATVKNSNSPGWGSSVERIIHDRSKTKVKVVLKDKAGKTQGQIFLRLNELIDSTQVDQTWFPLPNGGELRVNCTWKSVALVNSSGSGGYTPPIGTVRISIEKAEDLINLETIGKVDPYVRILVNGFERLRTRAFESTLNPTFNEVHYFTITSASQKLTVEAMDVENLSSDRTLGSFDVLLNPIISKNEKGQFAEYIDHEKRVSKLISKKGAKGLVTYTLSFYPTLPVKSLEDIKEEEDARKEKEKLKQKKEQEKIEAAKNGKVGKDTSKEATEDNDDDEFEDKSKQKLSLDELIEYNSGVFVFEVISGVLKRDDVYLQVYFDNHGYSDFVSQKLTKKQVKVGVTGDVTIKELDWSKAHFRIVKEKDDNRLAKPLAEITIPTLQLLKNAYHQPTSVDLEGGADAQFKIRCSWIPVLYDGGIPAQDSVSNAGNLTVTVERAERLIAADSNGKSDPYIDLYLNTDEEPFFKTKKIKKTLDPKWNETTKVEVANRYDSVVKVVCMDWDALEKNDLLGIGYLDLSKVPHTGQPVDLECPLVAEDGGDGGVAYFTLSFKPEFVLNIHKKSGTHIGDSFGTVGNLAGKGVGSVGKGIGGGLGNGVRLMKKGLHIGKDKL